MQPVWGEWQQRLVWVVAGCRGVTVQVWSGCASSKNPGGLMMVGLWADKDVVKEEWMLVGGAVVAQGTCGLRAKG